jgi:hypothetical protein
MSRERELLQRIVDYMWEGELVDDIKKLLAQPEQTEQTEQEPEAWILEDKKTGYRRQCAYKPTVLFKEAYKVIPLYTAPPKREPLSEDKLDVLAEANITDEGIAGYYLGFRDAEKHHGITGGM